MGRKIFWAILILAFILRFYKLGQIPLSLDWDENSNAYNAYSILKTGRDEYGNFLPLTNRSFDDYKPPLYMYLEIPVVALLGLTPLAARLPSAIFGFLTVPLIYFLTKKLFEKSNVSGHPFDKLRMTLSPSKGQWSVVKSESIALLAMLMLAISPWHLQFSRVGFEANVGLFLTVFAFTVFLYGLDIKSAKVPPKNNLFLILSSLLLGLSFYSYHSTRIFAPILILIIGVLFWGQIQKFSKKFIFIFLLILTVSILPLFLFLPKEAVSQRFQTTTQKARLEDIDQSIKFIRQDQDKGLKFANLIHNRRLVITQTLFKNYLFHFDLNFLFTKGDNNFRHHVEGMGMLYLLELPLLLSGIFLIVKNRSREMLFILAWLLISPIPASFGDAVPHAIRSLNMLIALEIIVAYALVIIYQNFKYRSLFLVVSIVIFVTSLANYLHNYFSHYTIDQAFWWQFGYSQAAQESEELKEDYKKIIIDPSIEQAYIFWLFNTKYDPAIYQQQGTRNQFDKYYFNAHAPENPKELFIVDAGKFPGGFEVVKTIYYPNGTKAIKIGHPK